MRRLTLIGFAAMVALGGCADAGQDRAAGEGGSPEAGGGYAGFTQAGAQDFGLFRQIVDDGGIPAPSTLDPVGFFAEHKLEYPPPACGQDVCMHGLLGVMGNMITGSNCTLLQIGLSSPIDVGAMERPPLNLVLALDTSGSMFGEPIEALRSGLLRMVDELQEGDQVSLVAYGDQAAVVFEGWGVDETAEMTAAIESLSAGGSTNIYDGLFTAFQIAEAHMAPDLQNRVILLSDGVATAGVLSEAKLGALAKAYATLGIGISTIGVGQELDVGVMRTLSELGAGAFYFLEDPAAAVEVFTEEVKTFMVPAALDVRIDVGVGGGYILREVYGTHGWVQGIGGGVIEIPSLFLAGRTDAETPVEEGRRGGGGAILVELLPRASQEGVDDAHLAGTLNLTWIDPDTGEQHSQGLTITNPSLPGEIPSGGYFSNKTVEKGFVMLNVLVGFQMALELAADGDPGSAIGVLQALRAEVADWLASTPDPDIEDDLTYVDKLIANLEGVATITPVNTPPEPWPQD